MKVIVYSSKWCIWCIKLKAFLKSKNIAFEEKDVDYPPYLEELSALTGQNKIPAVIADDKYVVGFEVEKLKSILNIK